MYVKSNKHSFIFQVAFVLDLEVSFHAKLVKWYFQQNSCPFSFVFFPKIWYEKRHVLMIYFLKLKGNIVAYKKKKSLSIYFCSFFFSILLDFEKSKMLYVQ